MCHYGALLGCPSVVLAQWHRSDPVAALPSIIMARKVIIFFEKNPPAMPAVPRTAQQEPQGCIAKAHIWETFHVLYKPGPCVV